MADLSIAEPVSADVGDYSDRHSSSYNDLKVLLHQKLLDSINLSAIDKFPLETLRAEISIVIAELLVDQNRPMNTLERANLVDDILDEILGLGPLEPLLKDPSITDILVNTWSQVFVERRGLLELTEVRFKDDRHLMRIISKIVSNVGRRIDESQPLVDARLPDGSRVNVIIPPLAVDGPLLSIRKFAEVPIDLERMVEFGTLPAVAAEFLQCVVKARRNILISGGTGSGKTTMLNSLSAFINGAERILTIEDAAELQLQQAHVGRMETRSASIEGTGEITARDLVKNALRMRPDRIVLGEVRGGEAFDMLQAMNTGHEGSMATIHANSCGDSLARVEQMVGMAGMNIPPASIRAQIASSIHIVVQLERMSDGRRRMTSISEVTGFVDGDITMDEIFKFRRESVDADGNVLGSFEVTSDRPQCVSEMEARGIQIPKGLFESDSIAAAA